MGKYAIYTAMVGGYDDVMQPAVIDDRFDYILFTDDTSRGTDGVWQLRKIPYHDDDNTRICRYVKTHPEELLPGYDFSIWVDSNVGIRDRYLYENAVSLFEKGVDIASVNHQARNCIYEEAFFIISSLIGHESMFVKWCSKLRKEGYPRNNGLFETNIVYRNHNAKIQELDALWWRCIDSYSRRDQLSFNYCLWKRGLTCEYFLPKDTDTRTSEHFSLKVHKDNDHNNCKIAKNEAWLLRYYWKYLDSRQEIFELYLRLCDRPMPSLWVAIYGQTYRLRSLTRRIKKKIIHTLYRPVVVTLFHEVSEKLAKEEDFPIWNSTDAFKEAMEAFRERGYIFVSLAEGYKIMSSRNPFKRRHRYVVVTFDDACRSILNVKDYLKEQNIPYTIFVNTTDEFNPDVLFSRQEVFDLYDDELVTIGLHGHRHLNSRGLSTMEFEENVMECHKLLKDHPRYIPFFAYPYGAHTDACDEFLKQHGFKACYCDFNLNYLVDNNIDRCCLGGMDIMKQKKLWK